MANKSLAKDHADICVLVTGGAGFIGSHTCVELLDQGYHVVVVDDLSNSSELALDRVRQITGLAANDDRLKFYEANILDRAALDENTRFFTPCARATSHRASVPAKLFQ